MTTHTMLGRPKRKAVDASAERAKKARGETDLGNGLRWRTVGDPIKDIEPLIVLDSDTLPGRSSAVGFDIDYTVIKTASGRRFATGARDWTWWDDCVPDKLRELDGNGHRVIFFTNQAGIEKQAVKPEEVRTKIEDIISKLGIPVLAFVSTGNNHYRKPSTLMWDYFVKHSNGGVKVDTRQCTYVGDAAGRAKEWAPGKPRDFSCSDRMFAANIKIDFNTPEEFFFDEPPAKFEWKSINPDEFLKMWSKLLPQGAYHSKKTEMVIMVGSPASGKSTFRRNYLEPHGYQPINRDTLGTMAKCLKAAGEFISNGQSVVIDNTNPSASAREDFIALAKNKGVDCRCFIMKTSLELANHLNLVRQNQTNGVMRRVPGVGFAMFKKNYQAPALSEGFSEIVDIDFTPEFCGPNSKNDEKLFREWTSAGR